MNSPDKIACEIWEEGTIVKIFTVFHFYCAFLFFIDDAKILIVVPKISSFCISPLTALYIAIVLKDALLWLLFIYFLILVDIFLFSE